MSFYYYQYQQTVLLAFNYQNPVVQSNVKRVFMSYTLNKTLYRSYKNLTTFIEGHGKQHQAQYLLPLRLFVGLGWLRAALEKLLDSHWRDGSKLQAFFETQIAANHVPFPAYQALMEGLFSQHLVLMSWLVALGQLAAGLAIFTGTVTTAAILGAIFLNINFMLAGRVNPSAFYLMMELVLLQSKAGQLWGLDAVLSTKARLLPVYPSYIKASYYSKQFLQSKRGLILQTALYGGLCFAFVPFIRSIQPIACLQLLGLFNRTSEASLQKCLDLEGFVDDPAMFLSLICAFALLSTLLRAFGRYKKNQSVVQ